VYLIYALTEAHNAVLFITTEKDKM